MLQVIHILKAEVPLHQPKDDDATPAVHVTCSDCGANGSAVRKAPDEQHCKDAAIVTVALSREVLLPECTERAADPTCEVKGLAVSSHVLVVQQSLHGSNSLRARHPAQIDVDDGARREVCKHDVPMLVCLACMDGPVPHTVHSWQ